MSNDLVRVESPFTGGAGTVVPTHSAGTAASAIEEQRAIAEVKGSIMLAKQFPRDQVAASDTIIRAFQRQSLAEVATYLYVRGGKNITGPSIRAAEAIAQVWGNVQFGVRELSQKVGVSSTMEAYAWDMETNTRSSRVFEVPHVRESKQGGRKILTDARDIYELTANQGARRLRACILAVIPGDVVEAAITQADHTLKAKCDISPERIAKMLEHFSEYGVTREQIEARIQRKIDSIQPTQLIELGRIANSIKDGMSKVGDWFSAPEVPESPSALVSGNDKAREALKKRAQLADTDSKAEAAPKVEEATPLSDEGILL